MHISIASMTMNRDRCAGRKCGKFTNWTQILKQDVQYRHVKDESQKMNATTTYFPHESCAATAWLRHSYAPFNYAAHFLCFFPLFFCVDQTKISSNFVVKCWRVACVRVQCLHHYSIIYGFVFDSHQLSFNNGIFIHGIFCRAIQTD